MTARLAAISASAPGESVTAAPCLATAMTSAKLTGPVPTMTVSMPSMIACRPRTAARDTARPAHMLITATSVRNRCSGDAAAAIKVRNPAPGRRLGLAAVHRDEPVQDLAAADPQSLVLPFVGHPGAQAPDRRRGAQRERGGYVQV